MSGKWRKFVLELTFLAKGTGTRKPLGRKFEIAIIELSWNIFKEPKNVHTCVMVGQGLGNRFPTLEK